MNRTALYIATAISLWACQSGEPQDTDNGEKHDHLHLSEAAALELEYTRPVLHTFTDSIVARGIVHAPPQSRIDIALPYGGMVTELKHYEGARVRKGELLAVVQHQDYISMQEAYLTLRAGYEVAAASAKRQEELKAEASTSEKMLLEARKDLSSLKAQIEGAKARLKLAGIDPDIIETNGIQARINVKAPVGGYITAAPANTGQYLPANGLIYQMVDLTHLHVELAVFPESIHLLKAGQKVMMSTPGNSGPLSGEVFLISAVVDPERRTVNVHVHPDDDDNFPWLPGTYVNAAIHISAREYRALPPSCAIKREQQYMAVVKDGDILAPVDVSHWEMLRNGWIIVPESEQREFVKINTARALAALLDEEDDRGHHSH